MYPKHFSGYYNKSKSLRKYTPNSLYLKGCYKMYWFIGINKKILRFDVLVWRYCETSFWLLVFEKKIILTLSENKFQGHVLKMVEKNPMFSQYLSQWAESVSWAEITYAWWWILIMVIYVLALMKLGYS